MIPISDMSRGIEPTAESLIHAQPRQNVTERRSWTQTKQSLLPSSTKQELASVECSNKTRSWEAEENAWLVRFWLHALPSTAVVVPSLPPVGIPPISPSSPAAGSDLHDVFLWSISCGFGKVDCILKQWLLLISFRVTISRNNAHLSPWKVCSLLLIVYGFEFFFLLVLIESMKLWSGVRIPLYHFGCISGLDDGPASLEEEEEEQSLLASVLLAHVRIENQLHC